MHSGGIMSVTISSIKVLYMECGLFHNNIAKIPGPVIIFSPPRKATSLQWMIA